MPKKRGRPREFIPKEFLKTALNVFWINGFHATSMADLMAASGLSSASIYKLYSCKREIFFAALSEYMDDGLARMRKRAQEQPPEEALRDTLDYCAQLSTGEEGSRGCFTIAAAFELIPSDKEAISKISYMFTGIKNNLIHILRQGQEQHVFRADTPAEVMAESLFMMLEGMRVYGKISPDMATLKKSNDFLLRNILLTENQ